MQMTNLSDGRAVLGGFNAICGLIAITTTSEQASLPLELLIELAPGKYRGVSADVI